MVWTMGEGRPWGKVEKAMARVLWSLEEDALVVSGGAHGKAAVDGVGGCGCR